MTRAARRCSGAVGGRRIRRSDAGYGDPTDTGVTLVELVVTVAILGIAFAAIVGGMLTSVVGSDHHRKQATAETVVRTYAELVKGLPATQAIGCGVTAGDYQPDDVGLSVPSGFSASATAVRFGTMSAGVASWGSCPGPAAPHLVTLEVRSIDNRAVESVDVVRRMP